MRITQKDLRAVVDRINRVTGSPMTAYERNEAGRLVGQIGNYHLSMAYGGYSLHRMSNEHGGVSDVLGSGHMPARELYERMHAWLRGYEDGRKGMMADMIEAGWKSPLTQGA